MTDEGISLEYEAHLAYRGEELKICPGCNTQTHRKCCPTCKDKGGVPIPLYTGDKDMNKLLHQMAAGEDVGDLEEIIRGGFKPVPRGE